jgi:hypothetical protein
MPGKEMIVLLRKLAEVGKEVNSVAKNGHNEKQKYDYACEADFKREVRGPFFSKGLVIIPEILERSNYEVPTQSGGSMRYVDVTVKYTVYDSETGESLSGSSTGTGSDMGDKAVYKAMTGAFKYWLSQSNMIPTGDDPEDDGGEKKNGTPANGQKPATNGQAQGAPHSQDTTPPPQHSAATPATNGNNSATPPQQGKIHAESNRIGWEDVDLHVWLKSEYKVETTKDLTKAKASEVIERMIKMQPGEPPF